MLSRPSLRSLLAAALALPIIVCAVAAAAAEYVFEIQTQTNPAQEPRLPPKPDVLAAGTTASEGKYWTLDKSHGAPFDIHPTYLYVPSQRLGNGKRGLLLVLHGCDQNALALKAWGRLERAADKGLTIAIPSVENEAWSLAPKLGCWDYDISAATLLRNVFPSPASRQMQRLVNLTELLKRLPGLDIDPAHVYVVGLSSGGAAGLLLACHRPDLFAGVGAIAAPSVGSMQSMATQDAREILYGPTAFTVDEAERRCRDLASKGKNAADFGSQVANIAFGDMDRNGQRQGPPLYKWMFSNTFTPDGQHPVASTVWSYFNAEAFARIYQKAANSNERLLFHDAGDPIEGGKARKADIHIAGKTRVTLLEMAEIGHAWPSGGPACKTEDPRPPQDKDCQSPWLATTGLEYPAYIADWFITNNLRAMNQNIDGSVVAGKRP